MEENQRQDGGGDAQGRHSIGYIGEQILHWAVLNVAGRLNT